MRRRSSSRTRTCLCWFDESVYWRDRSFSSSCLFGSEDWKEKRRERREREESREQREHLLQLLSLPMMLVFFHNFFSLLLLLLRHRHAFLFHWFHVCCVWLRLASLLELLFFPFYFPGCLSDPSIDCLLFPRPSSPCITIDSVCNSLLLFLPSSFSRIRVSRNWSHSRREYVCSQRLLRPKLLWRSNNRFNSFSPDLLLLLLLDAQTVCCSSLFSLPWPSNAFH